MKTICSYILSSLAIVLSVVAICVSFPRTENMPFDYLGLITGILGVLITVLVGWNIYTVLLGAIVSASQADNYDACNVWIDEIKQTLTSPEQVVMPTSCKKHFIESLMQINKSDRIHGLDEVVSFVAQIHVVPDPVS